MKSEKEKMLSGELYNPLDEELSQERIRARLLIAELNLSREDKPEERKKILSQLLPNFGKDLWLQPPFYCDYGTNIHGGDKVFFNFNCVILDVCEVYIGSRSLFGPNVQIYAASHPLIAKERAGGLENGMPVFIGDDVWVGGNVTICPGVKIGARAVIGAGSVVTKDIPEDAIAAGNPCRVIKIIKQ